MMNFALKMMDSVFKNDEFNANAQVNIRGQRTLNRCKVDLRRELD